jgi:hypothetical protein
MPGWEVGDVDEGYRPTAQAEGRWQTCAGMGQYEGRSELPVFNDLADAVILDDLAAVGKL